MSIEESSLPDQLPSNEAAEDEESEDFEGFEDEPAGTESDEDAAPTAEAILKLVHEAKGQKRTAKRDLAKAISPLAKIRPSLIDVRSLHKSGMENRSTSESVGRRFMYEKEIGPVPDWVFVGRVTAPESAYATIRENMKRYLAGLCTLAIVFADKPAWHIIAIYSTPGREEAAERIRDHFGLGSEYVISLGPLRRLEPADRSTEPQLPEEPLTPEEAAADLFITDDEFKTILEDFRRKKNLILQGPPGVGKTFIARRLAYALIGHVDASRVTMVQFHPSYSYEDFIQGWRPEEGAAGTFALKNGLFYRFCREKVGEDATNQPYVFIIDEINRANVSKVLGELMMLLEADKRGPRFAIPLTYSNDDSDTFYVPENVYVLGLMNTADRSLAMVDYALRRRFAFHELHPAFESTRFERYLLERGANPDLVEAIRDKMGALNKEIASDKKNLGQGYEIGHSFFCPPESVKTLDVDWYNSVINSEVAPLLREYWFDDPDTVEGIIKDLRI